ncbi:hypothetical protein [Plantactinospora sp. DSM 117369]
MRTHVCLRTRSAAVSQWQSGFGAVTVKNAAYRGTIAGNASTTVGYTASGNGSTAPAGLRRTSP